MAVTLAQLTIFESVFEFIVHGELEQQFFLSNDFNFLEGIGGKRGKVEVDRRGSRNYFTIQIGLFISLSSEFYSVSI